MDLHKRDFQAVREHRPRSADIGPYFLNICDDVATCAVRTAFLPENSTTPRKKRR